MAEITIENKCCIRGMKEMKSSSIDLVCTDPPYLLGKDYGNSSDSQTLPEFKRFSVNWMNECIRLLRSDGSMYIFMGQDHISWFCEMLKKRMTLRGWIVWHMTQGIGSRNNWSPRHEDILYFTKSKRRFTFNRDAVLVPQKYYRKSNNMNGCNPGNVWEVSHIHYNTESRTEHPTQKPEELMRKIILASSNKGDTVLDPFAGSGTTPRVADLLGRNCYGFEINEEYFIQCNMRLKSKFDGFDSKDTRMDRMPNDMHLMGGMERSEYELYHKEKFQQCLTNSTRTRR